MVLKPAPTTADHVIQAVAEARAALGLGVDSKLPTPGVVPMPIGIDEVSTQPPIDEWPDDNETIEPDHPEAMQHLRYESGGYVVLPPRPDGTSRTTRLRTEPARSTLSVAGLAGRRAADPGRRCVGRYAVAGNRARTRPTVSRFRRRSPGCALRCAGGFFDRRRCGRSASQSVDAATDVAERSRVASRLAVVGRCVTPVVGRSSCGESAGAGRGRRFRVSSRGPKKAGSRSSNRKGPSSLRIRGAEP